ncbi:hypothetical protein [Caviibacter abscessus]|uniref:hypothetical protein n=1 Tax=Caviibacter abscessus TaxID=1766719 RepID=UPI00082D6FDF|nr:hypothetical protein [Caviibacter abscessus]
MKKLLIIFTIMFMFTSCASIVRGTQQKIKITSASKKVISIYDKNDLPIATGIGVLETKLAKGDGAFNGATYTIKTNEQTIKITPKVNVGAFVVGNLFLPGFWGYIVDGLTGAMYDLDANGAELHNLMVK